MLEVDYVSSKGYDWKRLKHRLFKRYNLVSEGRGIILNVMGSTFDAMDYDINHSFS